MVLISACALACAASSASEVSYADRGLPFDTLDYRLELKIDYEEEQLDGTCWMTIANTTGKPLRVVPLLLYRLMEVTSVRDHQGKPLSFRQQVVSFEDYPQLQENFIEVELNEPVGAKEKRVISIDYGGYLLGRAEVWGYVKDRIDRDFTIIRDDSSAYPSVGYPSRRANKPKILQRFSYRAQITVPDPLRVANGGKLVDKRVEDGWATYTYESITPSWRMDFAIADYHLEEDGKNRVFCLRDDAARGEAIMRALASSLKLYSKWYGSRRQETGLTVIEIPDGWGSQTDVTTIIQSAAAFKDDARLYELYHEATHLWNVMSRDPQPPRWEEGLACFLQYLTVERLDGREVLDENLQRTVQRMQGIYADHPEYTKVPMGDFGTKDLTDLSYLVGRLFFAVMFDLVGEDDFHRIVGTFYQTYADTGASTETFLHHAQQNTKADLTRLFDEWINGIEYTRYILDGLTIEDIADIYRQEK